MRKYWLITLFFVGMLTSITAAKYIPYVEPLDGDWGDVANPWQMPGSYIAGLYGRLSTYGDVDVIAFEFNRPTSEWWLDVVIPVCGEHFAPFSPSVALIGPGLTAPEELPFALPDGMGAMIFDDGEEIPISESDNYLFSGDVQQAVHFEPAEILDSGTYLIAVWEPNGHTGAYALSTGGTHPEDLNAEETARMEEVFQFINSGEWMGQDCTAPLAAEDCVATEGHFTQADYRQEFPEQSIVGEGYALSGVVRDAATCLPIPEARIWFWMANSDGEYDGKHEGMLFTNQQGAYRIQSEPPGDYGPDAQVHLHISAPGYRAIETEWFLSDGEGDGNDTFDIVLLPE